MPKASLAEQNREAFRRAQEEAEAAAAAAAAAAASARQKRNKAAVDALSIFS